MPNELSRLTAREISLVQRGANRKKFLLTKSALTPQAELEQDAREIGLWPYAMPEPTPITTRKADSPMNAGEVFLATVNNVVRKADRPLNVGELGEMGTAIAKANAKPGELWYRTPPGCGYQALTKHVFADLTPEAFAEKMSSPGYRDSLLNLLIGLGAERSSVLKAAASYPQADFASGNSFESRRPSQGGGDDTDESDRAHSTRFAPRAAGESATAYAKRYRLYRERASARIRASREGGQ